MAILAFTAGVMVLERLPSVWLLVALGVVWFAGLELGVLPALLEWWAVRHAEKHGGVLRSVWFTYRPEAREAAGRERQRRDTQDNPSLW
ncbi:MAG: hypothetical protein ACHP85_17575 [Burkholderiales bacterium]